MPPSVRAAAGATDGSAGVTVTSAEAPSVIPATLTGRCGGVSVAVSAGREASRQPRG